MLTALIHGDKILILVEADGHHRLSCLSSSGRLSRHHALNDIIPRHRIGNSPRALILAKIPCVTKPRGLVRTDGRRPDGLILVPWQRGRSLLWDVTCFSTFAAPLVQGFAAELAASRKHDMYYSP